MKAILNTFLLCSMVQVCIAQDSENAWKRDSLREVAYHDSILKFYLKRADSTFRNTGLTVSTEIDRDQYLKNYQDTVKMNLKQNKFPLFLYNTCLDYSNVMYYVLNSETKLSLRHDLIEKLEIAEVKKLLELAEPNRLKNVCPPRSGDDASNMYYAMPYIKKSTWQLLKARLKEGDNSQISH
jgi:hypothetical protein